MMLYLPKVFSSYVSNVMLLKKIASMNALNYWSLIDLLEELEGKCE